jgi:hypothetical protein
MAEMRDAPLRCPACRSTSVTAYAHDRLATCTTCGERFPRYDEARDLFHASWSDAAHGPRYIKRFWQRLAEILRF